MNQKVESPSEVMRVERNPPGPGSRKSRRPLTAFAAAVFAASVGAPITYALLSGNGVAIPGAAAASSFVKELMNRSPGTRTNAALIKTKNKPRSEMLSAAVMPKLDAIAPTLPAILGIASAAPPIIDAVLPADVVLAAAEPLLPAGSPDLPLVVGGGGTPGGGGGVVTPPGTDTPPGPPAIPAVPEPSTWATMLLGFVLTGWAIRRRPSRRRWSTAHCQA